jgi:pantoate--beta-alanine ligase
MLTDLKNKIHSGRSDYERLQNEAKDMLKRAHFVTDYIAIRDNTDLGDPVLHQPKRILAAAWLGHCRLIDNILCE